MCLEGAPPLPLEEIAEHNPCCDCKMRAFSTTCHCKEKSRYECVQELRENGRSDEEIIQWLTVAGMCYG